MLKRLVNLYKKQQDESLAKVQWRNHSGLHP